MYLANEADHFDRVTFDRASFAKKTFDRVSSAEKLSEQTTDLTLEIILLIQP